MVCDGPKPRSPPVVHTEQTVAENGGWGLTKLIDLRLGSRPYSPDAPMP